MGFFSFLTPKLPVDIPKIEQAILHLEQQTSAELRVVVERKAKNRDAMRRASQLFEELKMTQTAARNGVLLYLSFKPRLVAVVGDEGIHQKVGDDFWQNVYQVMKSYCQQGEYTQAICQGIAEVEAPLAKHFPIQADDVNELENEVVVK